jgi:undecaprenyl-diphosphatase
LLVGGGLVLAALAYLIRGNDTVLDLDASAARWGHDHASHLSNRLLQLITDLGDTVGVTIAVLVVLALQLRRSRRGLLLVIPFLAVAIAGEKLVTTAIKDLVDRARPTLNPIARTLGPSFPSGHSSTAACVYAALALVLARGRGPRTRTVLAAGAVGIAVAVAASRVLLDVHWVSDVVAGLALGWAWFALCAVAFGGRLLRFGAPIEQAVETGSQRGRRGGPDGWQHAGRGVRQRDAGDTRG